MQESISHPGPLTIFLIFIAGLLTSLGPCTLSLLPITIAYMGGTETERNEFKIISFCGGVILSLIFAIIMGLNLLGIIKFQLPNSPNLEFIKNNCPSFLAPLITGAAFGLASSPCITPVLATLLAFVSQARNPVICIIFLFFFGLGQVTPLILVGLTTANIKRLLEFRKYSQVIPIFSGIILISLGVLNIISNWI